MTDEMLQLARASAARVGVENVKFRKGYLEDMPFADETVDVVISNCVINLSADKPQVLDEAARVLRPGGRFAISDVIADPIEAQPASASVEGSSDALTARFHASEQPRSPPRCRGRAIAIAWLQHWSRALKSQRRSSIPSRRCAS